MTYKQRISELRNCVRSPFDRDSDTVCRSVNDNEVVSVLYSLEDGHPRVDLSDVLNGSVRPEISRFVSESLLQNNSSNHYDDADSALENCVPFSAQYGKEREYVGNYLLDRFKNLVKHKD